MLKLFISVIRGGYDYHAVYRMKFKLVCRLAKNQAIILVSKMQDDSLSFQTTIFLNRNGIWVFCREVIPLNPPDTVTNPVPAPIDGSAPRQYYPQENGKFKLENRFYT